VTAEKDPARIPILVRIPDEGADRIFSAGSFPDRVGAAKMASTVTTWAGSPVFVFQSANGTKAEAIAAVVTIR
jgi:hypothetical protein